MAVGNYDVMTVWNYDVMTVWNYDVMKVRNYDVIGQEFACISNLTVMGGARNNFCGCK